ncbi:procathepsin L [Octopus bimaculoides]|uniref:Cathepsin L n=1 Tax=Octopus bimaculoides TaxID=37653 RepID=A0A0L8HPF9_OCTBM|nr:procathepsin L [Octopus bimaculoides]|eukprot:XP_014770628.1 PREDICTED: cathepsin L1-like [Octopus bimaculoides]
MKMKSLVAVLLFVACAASVPLSDNFLDQSWQTYMKLFNKKYNTAENEFVRRVIWEKNLQYVNQHNLEADMGLHTYWLGLNEYADLENREFVQRMNNLIPRNLTTYKPKLIFANDNIKDLPDTVDWRTKGYVTEVKNQAQCGSCWAFSTTGSLEGQIFKKTGKLVSLSEQNLVDCSGSFGNNGCEGGLMDNAFKYIKKFGIDSEASYPYEGRDAKCRYKKSDVVATDTGYVDVKSMSEDSLQSAVAKVGPISVAIDAGHLSFQLYKHGVYKESRCSATALDHGVLAVGYGTDNGQDYWLVKNSWGGSWGVKGYIKMARNQNNMCGIATQASYPTV